jgi:predicted transcriptional regulator
MDVQDQEFEVLKGIYENAGKVKQRDLARIVGLSVGMTNAIFKRLAHKGLLKIRKINNRNIQYVVSSRGIEEITKRSFRYFKRTIKNVVYYKDTLQRLLVEAKSRGHTRVLLVGSSDMDFIVEHICVKLHLELVPRTKDAPDEKGLVLYAEGYVPPDKGSPSAGSESRVFLREILI